MAWHGARHGGGHKGHPMSPATKAKISAALKAWHAAHPGAHKKHATTARGASRVGKPHPHAGHGKGTHTVRTPKTGRRKGVVHVRLPKTARRKGVHTARPGRHGTRTAGHRHTTRHGVHTVAHHGAAQPKRHGTKHGTKKVAKRHHKGGTGKHFTGHHTKRSAFALISSGAGYKHSYVGRLRAKRKRHSSKIRIRKHRAHRVWRRRK